MRPSRGTRDTPVRPSLSNAPTAALLAPYRSARDCAEAIEAAGNSLSRKCQADLTPAQNAKLLVSYAVLPMDSGGWKTGVGQLCKEAGRGKNYLKKDLIPKVMSTPDDGDQFARAERSDKGVPTKLTPRKDEAMKEKALEWGFDFPYEEMADALMELFDFTITRQAIADHLRNAEWNVRACQRPEPMLRDDLGHFDARAAFGRARRNESWRNWVDVDEKWFYTMALRALLKLPPGVATPKSYVRHKSHVPKTMFLAALGRPCEGFDGKVGIWRITKEREARYHKKVGPNAGRKPGDIIEEDAKLDAKKYVELMTTKVFPAIRKAYAGEEKVTVQHDGAPGHGAKTTATLLAEAGRKRKRGEPLVEIVQQPAQSPDFNICDLAFFRALAVAVRKRRRTTMRGPKRFDIDQLVEDVMQAFAEYPPEQLEKMWLHKSYVMGAVLTTKPKKGGSNYPRHDPAKRRL